LISYPYCQCHANQLFSTHNYWVEISLYFGCIGCTHSDINEEKLIDTIEGHSEFGEFLDERMPNSIEARTNKMELEKMLEYQKKLLGEIDE